MLVLASDLAGYCITGLVPLHSTPHAGACFRFGGLLHDWPESYFEAQQSRGVGLAGIFKQAIGQQQAQKVTKTRNVLARMFPASALAKMAIQVISCCPCLSVCLSSNWSMSCLNLQCCILQLASAASIKKMLW